MKYVNLNWLRFGASLHQMEYQISDELWCKSGAPDFYEKSPIEKLSAPKNAHLANSKKKFSNPMGPKRMMPSRDLSKLLNTSTLRGWI